MAPLSDIPRYPRTRHLEGSRLPADAHDPEQTTLAEIAGQHVVIEEKLDGQGVGVAFDDGGVLVLHIRGQLVAAGEDPQLQPLVQWLRAHEPALLSLLEDRFVLYGEWLAVKHTVFYDRLPHWFTEFDVFDRERAVFLSTVARRSFLARAGFVCSVPVLYEGDAPATVDKLAALVQPSLYKSSCWRNALIDAAERAGAAAELVQAQTDPSGCGEGLYVKTEADGVVTGRFKWVRHGFLDTILRSDSHWRARRSVANQLAPGVDLYAPVLETTNR